MPYYHDHKVGSWAVLARPEPDTAIPKDTEVEVTRADTLARYAHTGTPYKVEIKTPDGQLHEAWSHEIDPKS